MAEELKEAKKQLLTPDQVWELEQKKLELEEKRIDSELEAKKLEIASNEKIATENNKVAEATNKVSFWANIINGAKVIAYVVVAIVGFIFSWNWWLNNEAFELQGHLTPDSSKWSNKMFDWAVKRIDSLKNV